MTSNFIKRTNARHGIDGTDTILCYSTNIYEKAQSVISCRFGRIRSVVFYVCYNWLRSLMVQHHAIVDTVAQVVVVNVQSVTSGITCAADVFCCWLAVAVRFILMEEDSVP